MPVNSPLPIASELSPVNGVRLGHAEAGIKRPGRKDVLIIELNEASSVAGVFTKNRFCAAPVQICREHLQASANSGANIRALIINTGNANAGTGEPGYKNAMRTCEELAKLMGLKKEQILPFSTGVILEPLPVEKVIAGMPQAISNLNADNWFNAAHAIMTTDSVPKMSTSTGAGYTIGGMAKGAGMLAPGLATMLVVITTDAVLTSEQLDTALRAATRVTFDRLDSDGCMSTNDQVTLMASGASGVEPELAEFTARLTELCRDLAIQLQKDAEGASHNIHITVTGAASEDDAVDVARTVSRSNLFKAAIFGNDPNWGRVLAAVGTSSADFDPYNIDVSFNGVAVCTAGEPDQSRELVDLTPREVDIQIELHSGTETATIWTNDLTHDYVHENSAYAS